MWHLTDFGSFLDQIKKFVESFQGQEHPREMKRIPARVPHLLDEESTEQQKLLAPVLLPESCGGGDEEEQGGHLQQPMENPTPPGLAERRAVSSQQQEEDRECLGTPQVKRTSKTREKEFSCRAFNKARKKTWRLNKSLWRARAELKDTMSPTARKSRGMGKLQQRQEQEQGEQSTHPHSPQTTSEKGRLKFTRTYHGLPSSTKLLRFAENGWHVGESDYWRTEKSKNSRKHHLKYGEGLSRVESKREHKVPLYDPALVRGNSFLHL